jgi:hypothetical integral membrane protein (TIGR02206 family)
VAASRRSFKGNIRLPRGGEIRTVRPVERWSAEHLAALAATVLACAAVVARPRDRPAARRALAALLAAGFACEQLTYALRGDWSIEVNLPLQLTDAVTLVSVAALLRPAPLACELVYFWALSASLQAVLTPDLDYAFPDVLYFTYFATHCGAIVAAFLLVFGERRAPRPGAVARVYAITAGFAACAAVATVATGGNYMFLRRKPARGSLLDHMGPWPVYIVAGALLGLLLFAALAAIARALVPVRR